MITNQNINFKTVNGNYEGTTYISKVIQIDLLTKVKEFHNYISNMDTEVILSRNSFQCDATSLLGLFALDTSIPFMVSYNPKETDFEKYIKQFEVD